MPNIQKYMRLFTGSGEVGSDNPLSVSVADAIVAGEEHIGTVGGHVVTPTAVLIRPANTTAYASGDLVANSATAAAVLPLVFANAVRKVGGSGKVRRARLTKNSDDVTNPTFRLHVFTSNPVSVVPTNGDNDAIQLTGARNSHVGSFEFDMTANDIHTDGNFDDAVPLIGSEINFVVPSGTSLYGLLEARAAYTPASEEQFVATLEIQQD